MPVGRKTGSPPIETVSGDAVPREQERPAVVGRKLQARPVRIGHGQVLAAGKIAIGDALRVQIAVHACHVEPGNAGTEVVNVYLTLIHGKVTHADLYIAPRGLVILQHRIAEYARVEGRRLLRIRHQELHMVERGETQRCIRSRGSS